MDWTRIKDDYVNSELSLRALAKKYDISYSTVQNRAAREQWQLLRLGGETVPTDIKESLDTVSRRLLAMLDRAVDELDLRETVTKIKCKTEDGEVNTEQRSYEPGGRVDCRDLKVLTGALKDLRDVQMVRYPLDIREQEAKIRNLERQFTQTGDTAVTVTLEGEAEGYAQ